MKPVADPAKQPSWSKADSATIESAATDKKPIVLFFPDEADTPWDLYGDDFANLSKDKAVFIKIPYNADREKSPWAEESVIPTSKLLSDNPSREYNVPVGEHVLLVCDWYGNEYFRDDCRVKADKLEAFIDAVADRVEDTNEKLQRNLDKANTYLDKEDTKHAIRYMVKNFEEGVVGLSAQEDTIRAYHKLMDDIRARKDELVKKGDVDGLKDLAKDVKKTELEKEVDDAIEEAKKNAAANPTTGK